MRGRNVVVRKPVIVTLLAALAVAGCGSATAGGQAGHPAGDAAAPASPRARTAALAAPPHGWGSRPPRRVTPGAARGSRAAICPQVSAALLAAHPGRVLTAQVFAEYGVGPRFRPRYRIDLLVPADLDGTDSIRNLWPQPAHAFHAKNRLERRLHALVCSGRITLGSAQREIRRNWKRAYHRFLTARPAPGAPASSPPPSSAATQPPASPPPPPPPSAPPAPPASCHPLTDGGNCYEPGEFCRDSDHGVTGVAGDGETIRCEDNDGWRWEPV
jgi:hypothetical protein